METTTMTTEQLIAEENAKRAAWESETVATPEGDTIADLRRCFEGVCNPDDWKAPVAVAAPAAMVTLIIRAVAFFHADTLEVVGVQPITGLVTLKGHGYQAY